jgi:glycosyltransferase involved in cell wall biosynthesis
MRILFYFMHNPCPPRSGAHQRCLQILRELRSAGHEVIFSSSTVHSEQPWNNESKKAVEAITGREAKIFEGPHRKLDCKIDKLEKRFRHSILRKRGFREQLFCPHSLIRWFRKLVSENKPDAIIINYAWFDQLVDHPRWKKIHRIIEIHDLLSINGQMWRFVEQQLAEYEKKPDASKFRKDFIAAKSGFHLHPQETEVYQRYDTVLSISRTEQSELQSLLKGVDVVHAPFTFAPPDLANTYQGPAILSLGPNPYNLQGYLYFRDVILPNILQQSPGFRLTVTGSIKPELCQHPVTDWKGFVPNRDALFQAARFAVCPVFAGTGQQIKIVEAMAYGLAVVAFEEAAKNSLIKHGESGLIASSAEEFAQHVASLQNNIKLRNQLGQAAKRAIRQEWENSRGLRAFAENLGNGAENHRRAA